MNKLFAAAVAFTFALGSLAALADDKTSAPAPTKEEQAKLKADKAAAKEAKAKMTPEEKKAAREAKQKQTSTAQKVGNIPGGPEKAEAIQKNAAATKTDPKALPTKEDKQKALKEQEKKSSGQ
jgi:hypothetical protein